MSNRTPSMRENRSARGRSGRGISRGRNNPNLQPRRHYENPKKNLSDYIYYIGTSKQVNDYNATTKYLINHIKKSYKYGEDIGNALEERSSLQFKIPMPRLMTSVNEDDQERSLENEQFKILYKAEIDSYVKRKDTYLSNIGNAYALIYGQCSKAMQSKIQVRLDFESEIKGNPVALLVAIQEQAMSYQEHQYEMITIADSIQNMLNIRQRDDENLLDYTARYKSAKDLMESQIGGPIILKKFISNMKDEIENENKQEIAYEQLMTYIYLKNADKSKYGTLLNGLSSQYSLGQDQYPRTIIDANNILSNHRYDQAYMDNKRRRKGKDRPTETKSPQEQHEETVQLSFAQMEGLCYCCGKKGHKLPQCRDNTKPKEEWAINKTPELLQVQNLMTNRNNTESETTSDTTTTSQSTGNTLFPFAGMQTRGFSAAQTEIEMRDWILLDSQSTVDLFCNPALLENINQGEDVLNLATNAGTLTTNKKATLPGYGDVWYDNTAMTNVFSLANMESKYRVTYDSAKESAFTVHTEKGPLKFTKGPEKLYYFKPKIPEEKIQRNMVQTVQENESFYTTREVERAKKARMLLHTLGCPTIQDLKAIIRMNTIANCPVTINDIDLAEKIYGKDIASIKGKTTRQKPTPVIQNMVEIPPELKNAQRNVDLCFDTLFINGMAFLSTISKRIKYRTIEWLPERTMEAYKNGLKNIIKIYNEAGFKVSTLSCDREYIPLINEIQEEFNITPNYPSAQEHVPEAERNNRVIKERMRAVFHSLPFKAIPKIMIKFLAMECTKKLNYFPPKGGVSKYYSPREILHQQKLDFNKHCTIAQFSYVQAHEEPQPSNSQMPRALDCIYLRPLANLQGGHELLHLATGRVITRRSVTVIPMTTSVIKSIEDMATAEGMKTLQLMTKSGRILYDSTWIAGVDYTEQDKDEESYHYEQDNDTEDETETQESESQDYIEPNELAEILDGNPIQARIPNDKNNNPTDNENEDDKNNDEEDEDVQETPPQTVRRSARTAKPTEKYKNYIERNYNQVEMKTEVEYSEAEAKIIATIMGEFNERMDASEIKYENQFMVTYSLKKGIKEFGDQGRSSVLNEMRQLHQRECFKPINIDTLTPVEKQRALESLIFLTQKKDGTIKARHCANGNPQREWMNRDEVSSPTVNTESTLLTAVIEAEEERDIATCDIPNAFIQTHVEEKDPQGNRTIMKIRGVLIDILCDIDPIYQEYIKIENQQKMLYVHVTRAIYGLLESAMLFYKRLTKDLTEFGFEINPYDPCVANKQVDGKQMTVSWHVDDLKVSHVNSKHIDDFITWIKQTYGTIGEVKTTRGKVHHYLGMKLDYTVKRQVTIDMVDYVNKMISDFPKEDLKGARVTSPWSENLFQVNEASPVLSKNMAEQFHKSTAQGLFLCKRGRPDISPVIAYLTTRVKNPNQEDWMKLTKMMKFLNQTKNDKLTLRADGTKKLKWHIDAAFAIHPDFKSHTGATLTMGNGAITSISRKQKINTRSSTASELVAVDDVIGSILWTKRFLEAQGYGDTENVILQDNKSAIQIENNGRKSTSKRSRHLNIRYFFINDQKEKGNIKIEFCPTDNMIGDYMTKPLHGRKFKKFRQEILNLPAAKQFMIYADIASKDSEKEEKFLLMK
jgi:hypothetical protein